MICIGNLKKSSCIPVISEEKLKNIVVIAFIYVSESLAQFYRDFGRRLYSVDRDEARQ